MSNQATSLAENAALLSNDKSKIRSVQFIYDDFDELLRLFTLLELTFPQASSQTAQNHLLTEEEAGTKLASLHKAEARYYFCRLYYQGSQKDYILNFSWHMKTAHESGVKDPFTPPGHGHRYVQVDVKRVGLQTDCTSPTPSEVSGPSMNELELIDESRPSPSKYSDGGIYSQKQKPTPYTPNSPLLCIFP